MDGGLGSDTYLFGRGDGRDIVYGSGVRPAGEINTLRLKEGVLPADLSFDMSGTSLLINVKDSADQFRVDGFLYGDSTTNTANPLQQIIFADGTSWNLAAIAAQLYAGSEGADTRRGTYLGDVMSGLGGADNLDGKAGDDSIDGGADADTIAGGAGNDLLLGGAGNDTLDGGDGNDTLDGGAGNDELNGGLGNDTYLFGRGDGQDRITYSRDPAGKLNTLQLKAGVLPDDIILRTNSMAELIIQIKGGSDQITAADFLSQGSSDNHWNPLQQIKFADGTSWDRAAIEAVLYAGTDTDDFLIGTLAGETIHGLAGNDRLDGNAGNDTLDGGSGDDLMYGGIGDDLMLGGTGNDSVYGEAGNDTLDGGAGNDTLAGMEGNDVVLFGKGDGKDTLSRSFPMSSGETDILQFKPGVLSSDIIMSSGNYGELFIQFKGSDDQVTVEHFMWDYSSANVLNPVQEIRFADGTSWTPSAIEAVLFAGTDNAERIIGGFNGDSISGQAGADMIDGRAGNDTLDGGAGDDRMYGGIGDDLMLGGTGNDSVYGEAGNDTLDGGAGNDTVAGMGGNDVVLFGKGDGKDTLSRSFPMTSGESDILQFKPGVLSSDLALSSGNYGELFIKLKGSDDQMTVEHFMRDDSSANVLNPVQEIRFADGASWTPGAIEAVLFAGTDGAERINGSLNADTITGRAGADTIDGKAGNDTLDGGAGDDNITGGLGSDTYLFGRADGQDILMSTLDSAVGKLDTLQFKSGVSGVDLQLSRIGANLVIKIGATTDQVTAYQFFNGMTTQPNAASPLQQIKFADGTSWDLAMINAELLADTTPVKAAPAWPGMTASDATVELVGFASPSAW